MVSVTEMSLVRKSRNQQKRFRNSLKRVEENPQLNIVTEATKMSEVCGAISLFFIYEFYL